MKESTFQFQETQKDWVKIQFNIFTNNSTGDCHKSVTKVPTGGEDTMYVYRLPDGESGFSHTLSLGCSQVQEKNPLKT